MKQARLARWNPVLEDWYTRYRGFIESFEFVFDPSQRFTRVTINLVDIFEIIQAVEMYPGFFGHPAPAVHKGNVFFEDTADGDVHGMQRRITDILSGSGVTLGDCGIPSAFYDVFSGNVSLHESTYSPGESAMTAIQEAVDAEFPGVANAYCDRLGLFAVHGRYARFDPVGTSNATGWDFNDWDVGDGAAVAAAPTTTAHIRAFAMSLDLQKIINHAQASPVSVLDPAAFDAKLIANTVEDTISKGLYGIRPWSTQNLITKDVGTPGHTITGADADWTATKEYATYYKNNYADPVERINQITFRSSSLNMTGTAANWDFLCRCDINDRVAVTVGSPGGGGISGVQYFIEGVHENVKPLNDTMDDVTLTLDLSPANYFQDNPFST